MQIGNGHADDGHCPLSRLGPGQQRFILAVSVNTQDRQAGLGQVDLTGTPFKVIDEFCKGGENAIGVATISPDGKTVDLTAGGNCSWTSPTLDKLCTSDPQALTSGPALDLAYTGL